MNQYNVDMFILNKGSYFPDSSLIRIREILVNCDDTCLNKLLSANFKNPTVGFLFSIGLGIYGIDRFYIGHIIKGIIKLLLFLAFLCCYMVMCIWEDEMLYLVILFIPLVLGTAIWYILDIFKISKEIKKYNYQLLLTLLNY